jgi:hypothetical protein
VGTLALAVRGRALMRLPQPRAGFLVQDDLFHASKFTPLFRDYLVAGITLLSELTASGSSAIPDVVTFEQTRILPFTAEANYMSYRGYWRYYFYKTKAYWPENELNAPQKISYNGLYVAKNIGKDYSDYLRFYPDGVVISVVSTGTPRQVIRWFDKRTEFKGHFVNFNGTVFFSIHGSNGTISYVGETFKESIKLQSHSYITGYESANVYNFIPIKR